MPDSNNIHQRRIAPDKFSIRFLGKLDGVPYDVHVCPSVGKVDWLGKESVEEELKSKSGTEAGKGKDCPGCGNAAIKFAAGAWGVFKAKLGIDKATDETIAHRRGVCMSCDRYDFGVCTECECFLDAKVRLTREKCPLDKW